MSSKNLFSAALVTGAMFVSGLASAATLVTLNPSANNGGAGQLSADPAFQATGFSSDLFTTLVASGNAGIVPILETGLIDITGFGGHPSAVNSGVGAAGNYRIQASFTLTGFGSWAGGFLSLIPGGAMLTMTVTGYANPGAMGPGIALGTATLAPGPGTVAFATTLGGSVAPGSSGPALTSLNALLDFTPAPGTEGINGFFQSPNPFLIDLSVGNAGGNPANTVYTVDLAGNVTFVSPFPANNNPGTANVTFVSAVPEPGALSLAAVALLLAGIAARRKAKESVDA